MKSTSWLRSAAALLSLTVAACGSKPRPQIPAPTPPPQAPVTVTIPDTGAADDPVQTLIATSERHFANGQRQLELGHLDQAKVEFNRALDVLLESPYGARTEARIRDHFDRLVDRISTYELNALAQGDGFTEKRYEPASIDQLLAYTTFEKLASPPGLEGAVAADLSTTTHDVPIPLNDRVLGYVELFQGKLREFLQDGLQRGTRYLPMIQSVFRAEGLPLDLAYIPLIESAFKPNALSRAKAKGVWQFMVGTALENGLKHDWYIDERSDPEKATYAAAKYLKSLFNMFDGDWHLAMASYNGGPGRVQRALKRSGAGDFWHLSRSAAYLPRETREYVPMILAAVIIAKNPEQYGFTIEQQPPIEYDKVKVPRAIDLRRVAEWTGSAIQDIQELNPELRRWTTPVKYPDYEVKVPKGTAEILQARLSSASPSEITALKWYTVRRGDTLYTIARKLKVSKADLAAANGLSTRARVRTGQELIIPRAPATLLTARAGTPPPADQVLAQSRSLNGTATPTDQAPAVTATPETSTPSRTVYRVKRGDTLFAIARVFETTVQALKSWNNLRSNRINVGDRLTILR